jgi:hypothetical protein
VSRAAVVLVLIALCCTAAVVVVDGASGAGADSRVEAEARWVAAELFRTLGERRYVSTCALLADGYFAETLPLGRRHCALGLRIGFMWSNELRVRLRDVRVEGDQAVVRAAVNGVEGRILLVREARRLRILRVGGR